MTEPGRTRGKLTLLMIALVFLLPLIAAILYRPSSAPGNYGTLIDPPRPLERFRMIDLEGGTAGVDILRGKWTLMYVGGDRCLEQCRRNLYKIERVRLTQGEDMRRVQSLYLAPEAVPKRVVADTLLEYEGVQGYSIAGKALHAMAPGFEWDGGEGHGRRERIYIVDPLGNLMMYYPGDADPSGIKSDLERLLKVSQIG